MTDNNIVPSWIKPSLFEKVLRNTIPNFKEIKDFKAFGALPPGENYATTMLKIQIEVALNDGTSMEESLMMKVPLDSELYRKEMSKFKMFSIESFTYNEIVREFEQMYREVGLNIKLSPQSYKLPIEEEYVLLEDLKKKGFRNCKSKMD
ncbi:uncharacterized protein [Musca autumnalis]|uniref:uncharacterized protein n=1 Tax=Musca autumnalis TaxID=221902 RepID=UPI003CED0E72